MRPLPPAPVDRQPHRLLTPDPLRCIAASYSVLVVDPEFVRQIVTGSADLFPKGHL